MSSDKQTIHIIAGPTASGKSVRALELAQQKNGVIINCDSVQLYDGLPILTAQPSENDKRQAPHKLYGALHPNDICSAGNWCEIVKPVIEEALEAGQTPIIVGGTGLYIKALMEGLSPMPDTPEPIRQAAIEKQKSLGNPAFHAALEKRDPIMAARLHPSNTARLVRAWEVLDATGKSLAEWQAQDRLAPPENWNFQLEIIMPERAELYRRCNDRFVQMLEMGALDEVKAFAEKLESGEIESHVPLTKALGFSYLWNYLKSTDPPPRKAKGASPSAASDYVKLKIKEAGCFAAALEQDEALKEAVTLSQGQTRRYAKRQSTWFRNQM